LPFSSASYDREEILSLFDGTGEHPPSKVQRYLITTAVFVALLVGSLWYLLRFHSEKTIVRNFLTSVAAGQMEHAYQTWKPQSSYSYKDFLEDWGPKGYYGPVKSFKFEDAQHPRNGSGVVVIVDVSPYWPFPSSDDEARQTKTKEVKIWVQFTDHSLSFAP
jgi:hypothetical protein